jgi:hypothetical protein
LDPLMITRLRLSSLVVIGPKADSLASAGFHSLAQLLGEHSALCHLLKFYQSLSAYVQWFSVDSGHMLDEVGTRCG